MNASQTHARAAEARPQGPGLIADEVARHIVGLRFDALPEEAVSAAKRLIVDTFAVAWAGSSAPGSEDVYQLFREQGGSPEATVWAYGGRLPAPAAAFLNSLFGAALDYDGINTVHADIIALPTALAVGEKVRASGRELITAFIIGSDLSCRLGAAMSGPHKGWFNTSIYGVFGAAAAAARLLGLDETATRNALGVALSQAAGTQQANIEQALTKRMQSAFATQSGVLAALLAQRGVTAPREVFEGKFGLYQLYQGGEPERILDGLGTSFEHVKTMLKKYPACACSHAAIEGMRELVEGNDLRPENVARIDATISPLMHRLVGAPFDPRDNPQVTAQFSLQYGLASMLLRRRLGIEEIQDAAVLDPAIRELTQRIHVHIDETNRGSRVPAEVKVATLRGGTLHKRVDVFPWSREAPFTEADFQAKVADCLSRGARPLLDEARVRLIERLMGLESAADVSALLGPLSAGAA